VRTISILILAAALAPAASAQTPAPASANPIADSLRSSWNGVKRNIKESADQMPEANYSFKPTPDVRSFGEILAHVAGASYMFCAAAKGEKSPFAEDGFEKTATTKAAIVKATDDAITYCDAAFTAATDATLGARVATPSGTNQAPRINMLVGQIGHDNEHYGNLVTYFRIKGMVPPSSKR
jgi:uncharacterized damage-inducible protein DinB